MKYIVWLNLVATSIAMVVISGCYSIKVVKPGEIVAQNKTIEVPATGFSIMEIKSALIKNGWKIKVSNSNVTRVRSDANNPDINVSNNYDSAYRMELSESVRNNQWVIGISISIVNNRTNEEVLNMYCDSKGLGGCFPDDVAEELVKELREIEKSL